jgi:hypothetical protein
MYFEGRELHPCAEPISSAELREGEVYFAVNYIDDEMLTPMMETVVFIGKDLEPEDVGQVYFQDIESHREGVPYSWTDENDGIAKFSCGSEVELKHIFKYEKALDELLRCSIRRREIGTQTPGYATQ